VDLANYFCKRWFS